MSQPMTQFMPANASESNDNEVQLVGMSYNLGSYHVGHTQEYSSIMPPMSTTMLAFYDNQFLFEIPQSVWELVVMPIMGAEVLGRSRSISKFFGNMHDAFVANGVLQVSKQFNLYRCLHYVRTLYLCAIAPESTFKINVPAGKHFSALSGSVETTAHDVEVNVELIGATGSGNVCIVNPVHVVPTVEVTFRNLSFQKELFVSGKAHVFSCTFTNKEGTGAECTDGGVMRAFNSTFSNCKYGLLVSGQLVTENSFLQYQGTLLSTPQSYQVTFRPSTFIGHNCKFENNEFHGIVLHKMVNLFLGGKETVLSKNGYEGINGLKNIVTSENSSVRLSSTLSQKFCRANGVSNDLYPGAQFCPEVGETLN